MSVARGVAFSAMASAIAPMTVIRPPYVGLWRSLARLAERTIEGGPFKLSN
jgi:hypothetical protein